MISLLRLWPPLFLLSASVCVSFSSHHGSSVHPRSASMRRASVSPHPRASLPMRRAVTRRVADSHALVQQARSFRVHTDASSPSADAPLTRPAPHARPACAGRRHRPHHGSANRTSGDRAALAGQGRQRRSGNAGPPTEDDHTRARSHSNA